MSWTSYQDIIAVEPQITEQTLTETPVISGLAENLEITEPTPIETQDIIAVEPQITEQTLTETPNIPTCFEEAQLVRSRQEKTSEALLLTKALQKTRSHWRKDKDFAKAQKRMKNGKNLKKKDFFELYFLLRERGERGAH